MWRSRRHALRHALVLVLLLAPAVAAGEVTSCPADHRDEQVMSAHIFDGDTLALDDGRRVRLLGINTPEVSHDATPSEPYADEARALLARLAGPGTRLYLRLDSQRFDRYGRLLAHVFAEDGRNLQVQLLAAGYATTLVVPPNEWAVDCYARVEQQARAEPAGIWRLERYAPVPAEQLKDSERGFHLVTGRVQRVGESRANLWLNLSRGMAVRIPKADLRYFGALDPRTLAGRQLEVRGWLDRRRGELRMTVRHPAALRILD
jgi:endonuclease YncB( thermonuclease family)